MDKKMIVSYGPSAGAQMAWLAKKCGSEDQAALLKKALALLEVCVDWKVAGGQIMLHDADGELTRVVGILEEDE